MSGLVATMMDVVPKQLAGSTGHVSALPPLPVVVAAAVVFLHPAVSRTPSSFMAPIDTLARASACAGFPVWRLRKLLVLLVVMPSASLITIACSRANHAVLIVPFGDAGHLPAHEAVLLSTLLFIALLLGDDVPKLDGGFPFGLGLEDEGHQSASRLYLPLRNVGRLLGLKPPGALPHAAAPA